MDDEIDSYQFVSMCSFHFLQKYTAQEVIAEHIAIKIDKIKKNPIKRIKRWWNS